MIISTNPDPRLSDFRNLVDRATRQLNDEAERDSSYYLKRNAQLLEEDVERVLSIVAKGTEFENTIKRISGQKFPDIIAAEYYGVEVKSSKDDKWISLGGSVNESTRVDGIERIFMTFGKLSEPVEFRSRPYEDCLSEIVATHYPRYKINMNLSEGETIFDKMQIPYNTLRNLDNPIGEVVKYYKGQLKNGESLWWIDSSTTAEENVTASIKVRLWSSLSDIEKQELTTSIYTLFPEVLSTTNNKKYGKAVLWLASRHGIVDSAFRDKFSAGGKVTITAGNKCFESLPKVFGHIQGFATGIHQLLYSTSADVLAETWGVSQIGEDRISQWIDLVAEKHQISEYSARVVLEAIFNV
ncbi:MAG: hypothetical protein LBC96_04010 [Lachnospiraceae bacterium]|jgi:hypothetical protein|nr:hypothetical protein [Lachnospiraceae bacterium]